MRLHPGVSYPLERIVPPGGVEVCGHYLPEGTIVGMHAWVIHRDATIFGSDANQFKPERWLQSDTETIKRMESGLLTVGFLSNLPSFTQPLVLIAEADNCYAVWLRLENMPW